MNGVWALSVFSCSCFGFCPSLAVVILLFVLFDSTDGYQVFSPVV